MAAYRRNTLLLQTLTEKDNTICIIFTKQRKIGAMRGSMPNSVVLYSLRNLKREIYKINGRDFPCRFLFSPESFARFAKPLGQILVFYIFRRTR